MERLNNMKHGFRAGRVVSTPGWRLGRVLLVLVGLSVVSGCATLWETAQVRERLGELLGESARAHEAGEYLSAAEHLREVLELDAGNAEAVTAREALVRALKESVETGLREERPGAAEEHLAVLERVTERLGVEGSDVAALRERVAALRETAQVRERLGELLAAATREHEAGEYLSAAEHLREVLELDAGNAEAVTAREALVRALKESVETGLREERPGAAEEHLAVLERVTERLGVEGSEVAALRERVVALRETAQVRERLGELLAAATREREAGEYLSAADRLREVLELDAGNAEAVTAREALMRALKESVETGLREERPGAAEEHLAVLERVTERLGAEGSEVAALRERVVALGQTTPFADLEIGKLRDVLGRDLSATAVDENGWTDLHWAAALNQPKVAAALLDGGMDASVVLKSDQERLSDRLKQALRGVGTFPRYWIGDPIKESVSDMADLPREGAQPLHIAALVNGAEVAEVLLDRGADVNAREAVRNVVPEGFSFEKEIGGVMPLHYAALTNGAEVAKVLLEHGADVDAREAVRLGLPGNSALVEDATEKDGVTPLHYAAVFNADEVATLLIDGGADLDAQDLLGYTPLHRAAQSNAIEVAALLIDGGADLSARDTASFAGTPLHHAAQRNAIEVAALLIDGGANLDARNDKGGTLLHEAAGGGVPGAVKMLALLLDRGADLNARNGYGDTPLHEAAWQYNVPSEVAVLLLERGADVNAKNGTGNTPLHLTVLNDSHEVAAVLLEHGADASAKDEDGRTPLDYAKRRGTGQVLVVLQEAQASKREVGGGE